MSAPAAGNGRAPRATTFAVGGVEYLVTGRIARSLPAPRPLPPRFEHGGDEFPVVDLRAVFGSGEASECGPLLLLVERRSEEAPDGAVVRRALVVERLVGTEVLEPDALQPVPAVYPENERRRWRGLLPRPDGRVAVVLRLEGLAGADAAEGEG